MCVFGVISLNAASLAIYPLITPGLCVARKSERASCVQKKVMGNNAPGIESKRLHGWLPVAKIFGDLS